jgi:hypothetical protein
MPGRLREHVERSVGGANTSNAPSAAHVERPLAAWAVAVYREVAVEAGDAADAQPLHHRKARAIDDREVLVGKRFADAPGAVEISRKHRLDGGQTAADFAPEALRRSEAAASANQPPSLHQHVVGRHQPAAGGEQFRRTGVVLVAAVSYGVERRCIDKQAQRGS